MLPLIVGALESQTEEPETVETAEDDDVVEVTVDAVEVADDAEAQKQV